jgi:twitching motility protein PilT
MTGRVRDKILKPDETTDLSAVITEGAYYGMQTFDQALYGHVAAGRVSVEDALSAATSPHDFKLLLDAQGSLGTTMADVPTGTTMDDVPTSATFDDARSVNTVDYTPLGTTMDDVLDAA